MENTPVIEGFLFCKKKSSYDGSFPVSSLFLKKEDCTPLTVLSLVRKTYRRGNEEFVQDLFSEKWMTKFCDNRNGELFFFSLTKAVMIDGKLYALCDDRFRVHAS